MENEEWKRPDSVPFPSVWRKFEGKLEINGRKRKYWIQDVPLDFMDTAVNYMCTKFLQDEVMCKHSKAIEDKESVEEMKKYWAEIVVPQRLALICFTKDNNGARQIAGINMTYRASKYDKGSPPIYGRTWTSIYRSIEAVTSVKDIFQEFKVDNYLTAMGLFVFPEYRREGVGVEMLLARKELCLAVGISVTATVFTSIVSQKVAVKAGFKDFTKFAYEDLEKHDPPYIFPGITNHTKSLKFMYLKYQ